MISELEIEFNFVSCLNVYSFPCPYSNDSFTGLIDNNNSFIIQYFNMLLFYLPASKLPSYLSGVRGLLTKNNSVTMHFQCILRS